MLWTNRQSIFLSIYENILLCLSKSLVLVVMLWYVVAEGILLRSALLTLIRREGAPSLPPRSFLRRQVFRSFRFMFSSSRNFSRNVRASCAHSNLFGPVQTRSDALGCVGMRLGAFGCIRKMPENNCFCSQTGSMFFYFGIFWKLFGFNLVVVLFEFT